MKRIIDYSTRSIELVGGDGCQVTDAQGKTYLDFLAGWCVGSVGWKRHEVISAIKHQADQGIYVAPWMTYKPWEKFAETLSEIMPDKRLNRVFRSTSGSEAVEFAIKAARAMTGKKTIISLDRTYHGHTYGAATVGNALNDAIAPGVPGFMKLPLPDAYRGIETADVLGRLEKLIRANNDIAAFVAEPIFTNAGAIIPPRDFFSAIEHFCHQHNILLIMDEVATGFGRCGSLFASTQWGIKPDIMCLGKGMTGGYGSLGATVVTEQVAAAAKDVPAVSTFGWNPQDLAAAQAVVNIIRRERLWENAQRVGSSLLEQLRALEARPFVGQVRGQGLLLGIEIVKDKEAKIPDEKRAEKIVEKCESEGLLVDWIANTVFISPPLILSMSEAEAGAQILQRVFQA